MLVVSYKPSFIRKFQRLEDGLRREILEKIELLKDSGNHRILRVHKLHGPLAGLFSFSINYKIRIVFEYLSKKEVVILSVGDHEIYD